MLTEGQIKYRKYKASYLKYRAAHKEEMSLYKLVPKNYVANMYDRIVGRVHKNIKYRGRHVYFTKKQFLEFIEGTNFNSLFDNYIRSGKDIRLAPSVDRIDNNKDYSFDNIQLMTHSENSSKGAKYEQHKHGRQATKPTKEKTK